MMVGMTHEDKKDVASIRDCRRGLASVAAIRDCRRVAPAHHMGLECLDAVELFVPALRLNLENTDMDTFATFNDAYVAGFGDSRPARSTIGSWQLWTQLRGSAEEGERVGKPWG